MIREWNENMQKDWDLNIFFREEWDEENGTTWDNVITINPIVYTWDGDRSDNWYTDITFTTTFAEARYLRSQYPEDQYGTDWTDSLQDFLEIAPPRLKSLLGTLPGADETDEIIKLGGLRALPANDG